MITLEILDNYTRKNNCYLIENLGVDSIITSKN